MQRSYSRLLLPLLLAVYAGAASAHGNVVCTKAPKSEWKSHEELQKKLVAEGWVIRRMEATNSCYEVYAKDPKGNRVEAFFDPVTFARVEE
ncbi:PepSY domain-containing protein [Duganella qianjiadongensis]|uniref:PepSY domain-containing protein n=1 Tax=Duganella qianjiadongensis TaxID=2692176 RepID=A0ABW9VR53_9BURK|nr:PepSY domain-containing protein [Duganella qianjiadongensis]MYM40883.1 PepSY domain-containing protein [Duganella qianjiadongensis]